MALPKSRTKFFETDEGIQTKQELLQMADSSLYNTTSTYSANSTLYPDNIMSFVDKHMSYLVNHPAIEVDLYLANIRLMTKMR